MLSYSFGRYLFDLYKFFKKGDKYLLLWTTFILLVDGY